MVGLVVALRAVLSPGFLKNIKKKLKGAKSPHPENGVAKNIANVLSFKSMLASVQYSLSLTSWNSGASIMESSKDLPIQGTMNHQRDTK